MIYRNVADATRAVLTPMLCRALVLGYSSRSRPLSDALPPARWRDVWWAGALSQSDP